MDLRGSSQGQHLSVDISEQCQALSACVTTVWLRKHTLHVRDWPAVQIPLPLKVIRSS